MSIQYTRLADLHMSRRSLSRDTLHEIGSRRRKDRDVTALLWEIRRLRDLLKTIADQLPQLRHEEPVHREYFQARLEDLLEAERVRFDPKTFKPRRLYGGKPERTGPEGTEGERAAKRAAARARG
jgi:hypothetical protein